MTIALVFGGSSYEHEISIVSAIVLSKEITINKKYIFCDANKDFYLIEAKNMQAKYFSSKAYKKATKLYISKGGFLIKSLFSKKSLEVDVFLNLIHGRDGEDGKLAALFDFFDIKYIGPRLEASVLSFNKLLTKSYARALGINTFDFDILHLNEAKKELKFTPPFILKPLRLGSSIGIGVVNTWEDLAYAKDIAFEFDNELLVEPFISGIDEYNLAGTKIKNEFVFSIVEAPNKKDFFDFGQKYLSFNEEHKKQEANISDKLKDKLYKTFARVYNTTFEGAIIRCDFFVFKDELYLNEINPVPGSMAHYLFKDFNAILLELCKEIKSEKKIDIDYAFIHSINNIKK